MQASAAGAYYQDFPVGSCKFSDITVFGFHPVKIITREGGIATTNSRSLATKMRDLRSHGIIKDPDRFVSNSLEPWLYEQQVLGFNYRLSDIHAALGLSQLNRLDSIVKVRNSLLAAYKHLIIHPLIRFLHIPVNCLSSVHLAVIIFEKISPQQHISIFNYLRASGIGVQLHYRPVHLNPFYQSLGFTSGMYPQAEKYGNSAISIPLYPGLTIDQQLHISRLIISAMESVLCCL